MNKEIAIEKNKEIEWNLILEFSRNRKESPNISSLLFIFLLKSLCVRSNKRESYFFCSENDAAASHKDNSMRAKSGGTLIDEWK